MFELFELSLTVKPLMTNQKPTKRGYNAECHLKSLVTGSAIKCEVDLIERNNRFMPTVRGRHQLIVTLDGVQVTSSPPLPVFVSIHPAQ